MAALATAFVAVKPDTQSFGRDLTRKLRSVDASRAGVSIGQSLGGGMRASVSKSVGGIGKMLVAGFAAIKVGGFLKGAITAASDLGETINKTNIIFGKNAATVQKWAGSAARSFGLTKNEALGAAASFGDMFQQLGIGGREATKMSTGVVKLAADLGSFNNLPTAEVLDMISAGFRGEYDSLQRVIPNINAARVQQEALRMTHKKSVTDLTAAEKATATLAIIQKDGARAAGDFARTSGGLANQQKILSAQFGDFKTSIGAIALPLITKLFVFLNDRGIPALKIVGTGIRAMVAAFKDPDITSTGFVGVLERIGVAARQSFDYFKAEVLPRLREFGSFITGRVVPALADFGAWLSRNRDLVLPLVAAIGTAIAAVKVWIALSKAFVVVQAAVNAVLAANPIGIIIVALTALAAALVVAYKRSETFRNIVQAAWKGIQVAVSFAWNNIIKPAFTALVAFVQTQLGPAILWLWRSVIVPAFNGIRAVIQVVWPIIRGIFQTWVAFMRNVVAPAIMWLWRNVVLPVFNGIKATIATVWNNGIRPVLATIGSFIQTKVAPAFRAGVSAIGRAWDALKALAARPVNFVIGTVLNNGIFKAYNWVVSKFGGTKIPNLPLIGQGPGRAQGSTTAGLKDGGPVYGPGTGRSDSIMARLSNGEFVVNAGATARHRELLETINANRFADGGIVGAGVKEGIKRAAGIVTGDLTDPAKYMREKVAAALRGIGGSGFAQTIAGIPRSIGSILVNKVKGLFAGSLSGGSFGVGGNWPGRALGVLSANTAAAVNFIRQAFGIGNIGTLGNRPNASDHPFGKALDAMIPNWQSSAGISKGNQIASYFVNNPGRFGTKYVIWRDQINSGRGWRPYTHPNGPTSNPTLRHMDHVHVSLLDKGGALMPGLTMAMNKTGRPETVTTARSMDAVIGELRALRRELAQQPVVVQMDSRPVARAVRNQNTRNQGGW